MVTRVTEGVREGERRESEERAKRERRESERESVCESKGEEEVRKKERRERREGNFLKIKILFSGISKFKKFGGEEEENFNI